MAPLSREEEGARRARFHLHNPLPPAALACPHILFEAPTTLAITISPLPPPPLPPPPPPPFTARTQSREPPTIREEDTASTADTATPSRRSSGLRSCAGGCPPAASRPGAGRGGCRCGSGGGRGGERWGVLGRWSRGSAGPEGED